MSKQVYFFGNGRAEGTKDMRLILGGKGANLAEMTNIGVPVPPGFTIACAACMQYLGGGGVDDTLRAEVSKNIARLEAAMGKRFGDPADPLLVSVRSGAPASMPGMMETILNLGLNDTTVLGLANKSGDARFAYDSYRRFIQMYGDVVLDVPHHAFEALLAARRTLYGVDTDAELPAEALSALVEQYKQLVERRTGQPFPVDPQEQLWGAIEAVWKSWMLKKAVDYRRVNNVPEEWGTAVNIMAMVYGNLGDDSGTGVAFTRNPSTGENHFYGEFLVNAQGEDVVAGIRTPLPIDEMATRLPDAYRKLLAVQNVLERHFTDMQDLEFTVERGTLYLLQTRTGKRTAEAALRIAVDMVDEGLVDSAEAVRRVTPEQLDHLLHPTIDPHVAAEPLALGLPASPGAASGRAVFDPDVAEERARAGDAVILVREETTPEDFHGIVAAKAVVTARGGMTSHAAVVCRGMGKPAVVGCKEMAVDTNARRFVVGTTTVAAGDWITVDGATGRVFTGALPTVPSEVVRVLEGSLPAAESTLYSYYDRLLGWADALRSLGVRANADTPADARVARALGAEGIGLCRTEHMFFEGDRITAMREMIVARDAEGRRRALAKLLPIQRDDFEGLFATMDGLPVTIRLLDPPLHEFLPHGEAEIRALADELHAPVAELTRIVASLRETNPMLGHRGCRLGITFPEITEMQARAIFEAAASCVRRGITVIPEVMVPLVASREEFDDQRAIIVRVAKEVLDAAGVDLTYHVGTMIELPGAALTAGEIAESAEFFSFGTNDLTQTTLGLSRDDAGRFLPQYVERGLFAADPFQVLDPVRVGRLIRIGTEEGRAARPELKIGICGEHGGEPKSIAFCHEHGLDYVSCSPYRVPVARLAAARAALASTRRRPAATEPTEALAGSEV
ncbi:MAG TPA: pyruvate, phosphate dikinase [Gemmatimonadaceae bacterium]|nr:pyruvate, phosphate dikinase [Gemmatimonadaceae bacterium]